MNKQIQKLSGLSESEIKKYVNSHPLKELHKLQLYMDDIYYNTGEESGLTDTEYDFFSAALRARDPGYKVPIGARIREGENKIVLPFWLGSMDKFYPEDSEEISKWVHEYKAPEYIIEDKLDGVSCLVLINKNKIKMYTRGDGVVGSDISYLAQYFQSSIPTIEDKLTLRGELIIKKKIFEEKYSGTYANPRNMVAGVIGAKTVREAIHDIEFIAYEIVGVGEMPFSFRTTRLFRFFGIHNSNKKFCQKDHSSNSGITFNRAKIRRVRD